MKKFTFKTDKPTGRYKSFQSPYYNIKYNGKKVGSIEPDKPHRIRLMVIKDSNIDDGNPNCNWMWITLKKEHNSVEDAKTWINDPKIAKSIHEKFNIHKLEN